VVREALAFKDQGVVQRGVIARCLRFYPAHKE
jgi:hypothetical protein